MLTVVPLNYDISFKTKEQSVRRISRTTVFTIFDRNKKLCLFSPE